MARLQAPRIVYVSCNPTTLASDLKALREDFGYELRRCTPVDMFPHTPHIESVNLLELVGSTPDSCPTPPDASLDAAAVPRGRARARRARSGRRSGAGTRSRSPGARAGRRCRTASSGSASATSSADHRRARSSRPAARSGAAAARKSAKKRMSGGPMFAEPSSPGSRNAIEIRSNRLGCSETT